MGAIGGVCVGVGITLSVIALGDAPKASIWKEPIPSSPSRSGSVLISKRAPYNTVAFENVHTEPIYEPDPCSSDACKGEVVRSTSACV